MIKIGFKDYDVKRVDNLDDEETLLYGRVFYNLGVIKVCNKYSVDVQKCTLLHEVIHAVDDIHNIQLTEEQVTFLAKGLYQVLKDNPNMFEIIRPYKDVTDDKGTVIKRFEV